MPTIMLYRVVDRQPKISFSCRAMVASIVTEVIGDGEPEATTENALDG
jgi:hypothetical protein